MIGQFAACHGLTSQDWTHHTNVHNRLADVETVMKELADSYTADEIGDEAYHLYEQFRPSVAQGQQGWGRKGRLDFEAIRSCKK